MTTRAQDVSQGDKSISATAISTPIVAGAAVSNVAEEEETDSKDVAHLDGPAPVVEIEMIDGRPKDVYDRFTPSHKKRLVLIVSYSALLAPFSSSCFLPSIPQMAQDLHTTDSIINVTIAIFILTIGLAPVIWSPLAGFYGRKPVYLASLPIMALGSIGVAQSRSVADIIGTRILQGIGSSCTLAVGAGTIGDIYRPTERATAMGWFYSGALMGPALAPTIAGIFTQYTADTWRSVQYFLAGSAALAFFLTLFFLPETGHRPLPHDTLKLERGKKFVPYIFNPFQSLALFRYRNICLMTYASSCVMLEAYCIFVPLSTIFQSRYGITNVAIAGCLFLGNGLGNLIGARIAGPWADATVKKYIAKRGFRRPEDRLRAGLIGVGAIIPLSCLAYGWLVQYGAGGIAPPLIMTGISGLGMMLTLTPLNTYAIDAMQTRSAEVIAINNFIRYIFSAAASAFILPLASAIGWGWTMTIAAFISWSAFGALLMLLRWGHVWREEVNRKMGIVTSADEKSAPTAAKPIPTGTGGPPDLDAEEKDTGLDIVPPSTHDRDRRESADQPGHLLPISSPKPPRAAQPTFATLSRTSTKTSLPPVDQVLNRTVSLSGASVHGGG